LSHTLTGHVPNTKNVPPALYPAAVSPSSPAIRSNTSRLLSALPCLIFAASPILILPVCIVCLPLPWPAAGFTLAAIILTSVGATTHRLLLAFQGLIYLVAAMLTSGLFSYFTHALAGPFPSPPGTIVCTSSAAAIICYAIGGQIEETLWLPQLFHTLSSILAVGSAAMALIVAMASLADQFATIDSFQVSIIRTLVACTLALVLSWLGPRWQRKELVWLAYATLAGLAAKVFLDDLHQGNRQFFVTLVLSAAALSGMPGIIRRSTAKWRLVPRSTSIYIPR
jgi:hypothetical protein